MPIYKIDKKKNGKQQYRVVVNYTNSNGEYKQISQRVYGKSEAKNAEAALERRVQDKDFSRRITIRHLYEEYIAAKIHEVRTSTLNKTKSILNNHVLNTDLADKRIDRLTVPVLQEWKNRLGQKDIMISTKNNAVRELNTLLNYAVRMEYLPKNPLRNVGKFKDSGFIVKQEQYQYYTKEQFDRYYQAALNCRKNLTDYACCVFFYLLFYSGLRKGEMNALKWSDLEGNILHVRRSICQKVKGYEETPPKNPSSYRDVRLPKNAMKVIEDHKLLCERFDQFNDDWRLCGGAKPIADTNLENHNARYAELAGLHHITIHEFRDSHATLLINEGISLLAVQRRLGHSDIRTTMKHYAHLYPSTEEETLKKLESL